MESVLVKDQKRVFGWKEYQEEGTTYRIKAVVRYDDQRGNGHNTFSITGTIDEKSKNGRWIDCMGGCIHEHISKHFPELAPFIKWHLVSSDEPMHYFANTLYLAGVKDCNGKLKGEPYNFKKRLCFRDFPVSFGFKQNFIEWAMAQTPGTFKIMPVEHVNRKGDNYNFDPKYTFAGFGCEWHECPFDNKREAEEFCMAFNTLQYGTVSEPTAWGKGKEPELESARACAIWADATLEQLQSREALEKHLAEIMPQFKKDVESLGFVF